MKKNQKNRLNLPTILTLIRIVLAIPMIFLLNWTNVYMNPWCTVLAFVFFVVAAVTDFIDGRLARKNNQVTDLGAFLDPLADKMLVNLTILSLVSMQLISGWVFAIILVRDFAVDGIRMMAARNGKTIAASMWGKAKTMTQMVVLALFIVNLILMGATAAFSDFPSEVIRFGFDTVFLAKVFEGIIVALTVVSGLDVIIKGWSKAIKS